MKELNDIIKNAADICLYIDGKAQIYPRGEERFDALLAAWTEMTAGAHRMPAFGVSIDRLTREELSGGIWLEFLFSAEQTCAGMPFKSLLIKVERGYKGFNVIRCLHGRYEGRCYYVDLGGEDMYLLSDAIGR